MARWTSCVLNSYNMWQMTLCVCVCVCVCVCMYYVCVYLCVNPCVRVRVCCLCVDVCMYVCMCVCMYECMYVCIYIQRRMYKFMFLTPALFFSKEYRYWFQTNCYIVYSIHSYDIVSSTLAHPMQK